MKLSCLGMEFYDLSSLVFLHTVSTQPNMSHLLSINKATFAFILEKSPTPRDQEEPRDDLPWR